MSADPASIRAVPSELQNTGIAPRATSRTASRTLGLSVMWTLGGNIGFALCQWLVLVVLAKLGRPEMVGQFALALGLTAPIMLLASLNLRAVQSTDIRNEHSFSDYFRLRLCTTLLALAVCLAIVIFASFSLKTATVIAFVALAKASESVSDVFYGRLQKQEQMNRIARSMLVRGGASLLAMTTIVWATGSVVWGTLGMFLAWLTVLVTYDIRSPMRDTEIFSLRHDLVRGWSWQRLQRLMPLAWLALPLGIVQMLISLNANVPRFFIQAFAGEHSLGIYSAIAYVTVAGSTLVVAVGQAVSPRLARMYAYRDRAGFIGLLQGLTVLFSVCCALAVAIVVTAGGPILALLYTPEYASESSLLLIFTVSFGVGSIVSVLGFGITAARRFRPQVPLVTISVVAATISSAILIHQLGIIGAAWSVLFSLVVWSIGSACVLRSVLNDAHWTAPSPGVSGDPRADVTG
ncbi:MAG: lipopolysaccharide biosynthesis protein [Thermomicrobiales bacterium]